MGIFDWLFGKKETPSDPKKDCCSNKEVEVKKENNEDNSNDSILRINESELEMYGDMETPFSDPMYGLTLYKNKPFTGIKYVEYENGQLKEETNFLNGQKHGLKKWYDKKGVLRTESEFISSTKTETPPKLIHQKKWDPEGRLYEEKRWDKDGKDWDDPILEKCWDRDGNEIECK